MGLRIHFLGAADTVTGSRYLLESGRARVLVDCGLFQGFKKLRARNWEGLRFDADRLDAVVLTHAHIDHSGYLPKLCKLGYAGRVHVTHGTRDLLQILLPDSGFLQEEDARRANKHGYTRHQPAEPLYTREDAERSLEQLEAHDFAETVLIAPGVTARFTRAGHIIGSASVEIEIEGTVVCFSGDVGRPNDPIMNPPEPLSRADYLVIESTYGQRRHPADDVFEALAKIVNETIARGGVLVVPSFAVGRSQHLLHILARLRGEGRIPRVPIYLDSPMAIEATAIFEAHRDEHRISPAECKAMGAVARYTPTSEESREIGRQEGPMIILSASGMATGGRVLHHLRRVLPDPKSTVLFMGYQAGGTRGRALLEGADELKLHGQYVPVRARVLQVEGLSAHADYAELIDWLRPAGLSPRRVFVTHGEPVATDAFRRRLRDAFGWDAVDPDDGSIWELSQG